MEGGDAAATRPRSAVARALVASAVALAFAILMALGVWQVHRLAWKNDLVARVAARVNAPAQAPPGPAEWAQVTAARDEYRRVSVAGTFDHDRETLVQALTAFGAGYWVMTPLSTADGSVYLVNRGFVPPDRRSPALRAAGNPSGVTTVAGLLRMSEPKGGFLRSNDPGQDRWYSRDVPAIATARGLTDVAPFFIDADRSPVAGGVPIGGLTVIDFPNNHLVYAITWFALALLLVVGTLAVVRREWRHRRRPGSHGPSLAS